MTLSTPDILILGVPNDMHVAAVEWGLGQLGVSSYVLMASDIPDLCQSSIEIDALGSTAIRVHANETLVSLDGVKVVWNRRWSKPTAPSRVSSHDVEPVEAESLEHFRCLVEVLGVTAEIVNAPWAQQRAVRKAVQIITANSVGLKTIPTILSNSPGDIAAFCNSHGPAITKSHRPTLWINDGVVYSRLTAEMPPVNEISPNKIIDCPMIVQSKVRRVSEVRIVAFGSTMIAVQSSWPDSDEIDGRLAAWTTGGGSSHLVHPPHAVAQGCRDYMAKLSLKYAAFDFIIDEGGDWLFLECNEAGQFLYLEKLVPASGLLASFCHWLAELAGVPAHPHAELSMASFGDSYLASERSGDVHKRATRSYAAVVESR